jgi:hypothetical protein
VAALVRFPALVTHGQALLAGMSRGVQAVPKGNKKPRSGHPGQRTGSVSGWPQSDRSDPDGSSDEQRAGGQMWQHFRAPDGNVYEIIGRE